MFTYDTEINEVLPYLSLSKPKQHDQNVLHIDVSCNEQPLGIQTPRLSFENNDKFKILFDGKTPKLVSKFYSFFRKIDNHLLEKTSETLRKYIPRDIETDGLYNSIINSPCQLGQAPYINVGIFDNVTPQNLDYFPSFGIGTFIIALKNITVTRTSARAEWNIVQCLIHLPKMNIPSKISIKEPLEEDIVDDEEESLQLEQITVDL